MRKAFRHTGVLMMVAVVALGLIGAAYTLWYEDLIIRADLKTGVLDADWSCEGFPEDKTLTNVKECESGSRPVASIDQGKTWLHESNIPRFADKLPECKMSIGDVPPADSHLKGDENILLLQGSNLYPYAGCEYSFDIHNSGTVPFHLSLKTGSVSWEEIKKSWNFEWDGACRFDPADAPNVRTGDTIPEWLLLTHDGRPLQLHTGDELLCKLRITLRQHILGTTIVTPENTHFAFDLIIRAHQWNETAAGGPLVP